MNPHAQQPQVLVLKTQGRRDPTSSLSKPSLLRVGAECLAPATAARAFASEAGSTERASGKPRREVEPQRTRHGLPSASEFFLRRLGVPGLNQTSAGTLAALAVDFPTKKCGPPAKSGWPAAGPKPPPYRRAQKEAKNPKKRAAPMPSRIHPCPPELGFAPPSAGTGRCLSRETQRRSEIATVAGQGQGEGARGEEGPPQRPSG